jgi:hypothetical protein
MVTLCIHNVCVNKPSWFGNHHVERLALVFGAKMVNRVL